MMLRQLQVIVLASQVEFYLDVAQYPSVDLLRYYQNDIDFFVELFPNVCVTPVVPVGKLGVPVNVGEFLSAFASTEACKAIPEVAACTKAVVAI